MRDTAVFYSAWFEAARELPPDDFKKLFLAIADYAFDDREEAELPPLPKAIFVMAKPIVKKNIEKWNARKEAGRPALPITKGEVEQAQKSQGTVKSAAQLLGISERTAYRRKSLSKDCQITTKKEIDSPTETAKTATRVNVNVNVNANVRQTAKKASPRPLFDEGGAALLQEQEESKAWEEFADKETDRKAQAIFDAMKKPFSRDHEKGLPEEQQEEEQAASLVETVASLADTAQYEAEETESETAEAFYKGQAQAYTATCFLLEHADTESVLKQLKCRENRAFIERNNPESSFYTKNYRDGEFRAYKRAIALLEASRSREERNATADNAHSVYSKRGNNVKQAVT